jgi:glycosyltransferase involved in cell wall biosynthesis
LIFSPYCVDTSPFRTEEDARVELRATTRFELGIQPDDLVILFSGKLSERKGPDLIVEAVRQVLRGRQERIVIVFMGNGELLAELKAAASREPALTALFLGFQNQTQLSRFYHAADLLVLPSRKLETWGLVVNEALHHGLPCLVSQAVGCAPDLVTPGETGEVFETDSVAALAVAIASARTLAGKAAVRAACRSRAQNYSVDRAAEGIAQAYEAALS